MAKYVKPDGSGVLEIPDDVSAQRRAEILKEEGIVGRVGAREATVGTKVSRKTPEQQEARRRAEIATKAQERIPTGGFMQDLSTGLGSGLMSGFEDTLAGGVGAVQGAITAPFKGKNPLTEGAREYRISRDQNREMRNIATERHPSAEGIGELAGAVMSPVSRLAGAGIAKVGAPVLKAAVPGITAKVASALAARPTAQAILGATGQGALNAAGENEDSSHIVGDTIRGGVLGGAGGAAFAGLGKVGHNVLDVLRNANPARMEETAYGKVAEALSRSGTPAQRAAREAADEAARQAGHEVVPGTRAAQEIEQRLSQSRGEGVDEIVADVSPQLRGGLSAVVRNPNLAVAGDIAALGEARQATRQGAFSGQISKNAGPTDAVAREVALQQSKKAAGAVDYDPSVMQKPFVWNDRLHTFVESHATEDTREAFKNAADLIRNTRDPNTLHPRDPTTLGFNYSSVPGGPVHVKVPNMEAFDYVKRGYDKRIGEYLAKGDKDGARRVSNELKILKDELVKANPEYGVALANQRDHFQKLDALENGQRVLRELTANQPGSGARELLENLKNMPAHVQDDYRLGIMDAITRLDSKANPFAAWKNATRSPEQKQVMEWALQGRKEFQRFDDWVTKQQNAAATDVAASTKSGSITSTAELGKEMFDARESPMFGAFAGFAFGGAPGAIAGAGRAIARRGLGLHEDVQDMMGRLLISRGESTVPGEKLSEGITRVGRRIAKRREFRKHVISAAAHAGQQTLSGYGATKNIEDQ